MSDIPVSTVVRVTISTAPTFPTRKGFGTLNIIGVSEVIGVAERFRVYANMDGVEADFPAGGSEEWAAANTYFSQRPAPAQLIISRRAAADVAAELRGGGNPETVIATWAAIVDGSLKLTINGVLATATAISFAAVVDMAGVAAAIQAKLRLADVSAGFATATVTFAEGRFYVRSGTTGALSTIGFAVASGVGTDLINLMEVSVADATKADGVGAESAVQALDQVSDASQDWYGFAFTRELRDNKPEILAAAAWTESRTKVFANDTDDLDTLDSVNTSDVAYELNQLGYRRTITSLNYVATQYLAISAIARAFVVNFNARNSTITLKFKQMLGITPFPLRTSQKQAMDKKQANAYYTVGGNPMYGEGRVAAKGVFFDEVHGIDWLQNAIENNVFGKLYTDETKTPMTDPGAASLQQKVEQALDEGVYNGLAAPGYTTDGVYLQKGYVTETIPMKDWDQSYQEARQGPPITFVVLGAGAIHGIEINGTYQR